MASRNRKKDINQVNPTHEPEIINKDVFEKEGLASQIGLKCEKCGSPLVFRRGKYGDYFSCTSYPLCKFIVKYDDAMRREEEKDEERKFSKKIDRLLKERKNKKIYKCPVCRHEIGGDPGKSPVWCPFCGEYINSDGRVKSKVFIDTKGSWDTNKPDYWIG
ncbi:MAG: topoisomerase DNA-binding C4 zinc finger domain-containing protein [Planctomycetes bacterium]|nr:topoisomerase DNA-binding C4 zinc finger domain-containing protein [Planctomycetota bacterium]